MKKLALLLLVLPLLMTNFAYAEGVDDPKSWRAAQDELASLGDGFLVWESSRTGSWRLWTRPLNADGKERQLSADEKDRDHFCPHLSPDGTRLVYLSYPKGKHTYEKIDSAIKVPLYLMDVATGKTRPLADNARAYGEDRAAVWRNDHELVYIGADEKSYLVDADTGKRSVLVKDAMPGNGQWSSGWLVDPTMQWAVTGEPFFSAFDAKTQKITVGNKQGGCQPYFSRDGRWGFWMGGAGGPINRLTMGGGEVVPIVNPDDNRMPRGRRYLYFPMISACQRLFTFAASPSQHDHFTSDYDIFVARIDPATLMLQGKPVRYTFDSKCDRFSDVHLSEPALGWHWSQPGEAVTLTVAAEKNAKAQTGAWRWHLPDGSEPQGPSATFSVKEPGGYYVTVERGNAKQGAWVQVIAPTSDKSPKGKNPPEKIPATPVATWQVKARLLSKSTVETAKQILPYRQGLVMCEYQVIQSLAGTGHGRTVRVRHWSILDGKPTPAAERPVGEVVTLTLEPMAGRKDLLSQRTSDTLEADLDVPEYTDAAPLPR